MYKQQYDARFSGLSRIFVLSCVLGILFLPGAGSGADAATVQNRAYGQPKDNISSLQGSAEQLRSEGLQLARKATLQDLTAAVTQLRRSASVFRAARQPAKAAADYLSIGEIYFGWSRYRQALRMYRLAIPLIKDSDPDLK